MRVIGTAGHVDHGKSTLVRALTGIDPDRLSEEKSRGMTIDLGFAWATLSDSPARSEEVGFVDVPGHIDFIKNMLAGIGGIDAALIVVAADEGIMPQTREHLAILDLLAIPAAVVALTRTDLVDDRDWIDLVELDIAGLLETTRFAGSPIVRVSAPTGQGLPALRAALLDVLARLAPRQNNARPRLAIDRVFTLSGHGTVVTGTLIDGAFMTGETIEIAPPALSARIRGMQTHRKTVGVGEPGSRLALNLVGVEPAQIRRGHVVARPGSYAATTLLDAKVRVLPDATRALRHNARFDFFAGASEARARVRVLGADVVAPGESGYVQIALDRPVVVADGDAFILRVPSPSETAAGGSVLFAHPGRKWRRYDRIRLEALRVREAGNPSDRMLDVLRRFPFQTDAQLAQAGGMSIVDSGEAIRELLANGSARSVGAGSDRALIDAGAWERLYVALRAGIADYHAAYPLRRGIPRGEARSRAQAILRVEALSARRFGEIVNRLAEDGLLGGDEERLWLPDFTVSLSDAQKKSVAATLAAFEAASLAPPNRGDTLALLGGDPELLGWLAGEGFLVSAPSDVLFASEAFQGMVDKVLAWLREHDSITLAEARDLLGTSRKYVQSLLEEMDARHLTRRTVTSTTDARVLR